MAGALHEAVDWDFLHSLSLWSAAEGAAFKGIPRMPLG